MEKLFEGQDEAVIEIWKGNDGWLGMVLGEMGFGVFCWFMCLFVWVWWG